MKTFLYVVLPCRPNLINDGTPDEFRRVEQHFIYLQGLLETGVLILAGPCEDGAFGIVIFEAKDREAAEGVVRDDPAVSSGVMTAELHPYRISLMRGRS